MKQNIDTYKMIVTMHPTIGYYKLSRIFHVRQPTLRNRKIFGNQFLERAHFENFSSNLSRFFTPCL